MDRGYPAARPEARGAVDEQGQSTRPRVQASGEVTSTDADVLVIQFAGRPDVLTLHVRAFAAVFTLQDEMGVELAELPVSVGTPFTSPLAAARVLVRNATAASAALVSVTGTWWPPRSAAAAAAAGAPVTGS